MRTVTQTSTEGMHQGSSTMSNMKEDVQAHPLAGSRTREYFSNDDGSIKVPAIMMVPEQFKDIRADLAAYKWKERDFLLDTYPKNGTHFMWEVMTMLLRGKAEHVKEPKQMVMIDLFPISNSEKVFPSPRVLNTHYRPDVLSSEFRGKKTVVVIRNPKDTCVSYFHHETKMMPSITEHYGSMKDMSFSSFVKMFLFNDDQPYGSYFDYTEYMWSLRDQPNILIVFFEDVKTNPVETIQKVNEFMGMERSPELVQEIADATTFDKMKKGKQQAYKSEALSEKLETQELASSSAKAEALKKIGDQMFRKGQIGDWKNHFTVADNEMFDAFLENWEAGKSIPFRY